MWGGTPPQWPSVWRGAIDREKLHHFVRIPRLPHGPVVDRNACWAGMHRAAIANSCSATFPPNRARIGALLVGCVHNLRRSL
jgi:hypothetical protein